jgi:acyl carrier protein
MKDLQNIEQEVMEVIQSYMPERKIYMDWQLIRDLRMDSDDATAMINELERKFEFTASVENWKNVATPDDVVHIVIKHLPSSRSDQW